MLTNKWTGEEETPKEILEYLLVSYMHLPLEYIRYYMLNKDYVLYGKLTLQRFLVDQAAAGVSFGDSRTSTKPPIKNFIPSQQDMDDDAKLVKQQANNSGKVPLISWKKK